jgi:hypothetical protein
MTRASRSFSTSSASNFPDATIESTAKGITAKSGTMIFTVHSKAKNGEVSKETHQREGPNFKGFLLQVGLREGKYEGAAATPQTLREPYFPVFIDARPTADGSGHYSISFAYGSRFNQKAHAAIQAALPGASSMPPFGPGSFTQEPALTRPAR